MNETLNLQRLPKWAQEHIAGLQRQRDSAQTELRNILDTQTETKIYVSRRALDFDDRQYIQDDRVSFVLPQGTIQISIEDKELRCLATAHHGDFVVAPGCANVVMLRFQERHTQ